METITEDAIVSKTRELCQTIVDQAQFDSIRRRIDVFMADESARAQYEALNEKGEALHHRQQQGQSLGDEEIAAFERDRTELLQNPVAVDFLEAQQEMHEIQKSIGQHVSKTFELGRLPEPSDFESCGCGSGCGCH